MSPGWAEPRKWEDVGPVRRGEDERVEGGEEGHTLPALTLYLYGIPFTTSPPLNPLPSTLNILLPGLRPVDQEGGREHLDPAGGGGIGETPTLPEIFQKFRISQSVGLSTFKSQHIHNLS